MPWTASSVMEERLHGSHLLGRTEPAPPKPAGARPLARGVDGECAARAIMVGAMSAWSDPANLDNPLGTRLSPMSQVRSVTYVSGLDRGGLARSEGFEPPTLGIEIRCSIQLSYERPGPGDRAANRDLPDRLLTSQHTGRRSDGFELAERPTNKKPSPPRFEADRRRSHQVVLKSPKCGCWATSIIGRPGAGAGCALTTLRLG